MCLFKESKLYVENAQKEHNRAFFVCTLRIWASIPDLDFLGAMSQLPHLYSTVCLPKLTWMGFSTMASSFLTPTSIGSSSSSLTGVAVGVGGGVGLHVLKKLRQFPNTYLRTRLLKGRPPLRDHLVASGYCTNGCK